MSTIMQRIMAVRFQVAVASTIIVVVLLWLGSVGCIVLGGMNVLGLTPSSPLATMQFPGAMGVVGIVGYAACWWIMGRLLPLWERMVTRTFRQQEVDDARTHDA